jgi:hypothetical protein
MKRKSWLQVIVFGALIGGILILLDSKYHWFEKEKPRVFRGPIDIGTDKVYFTKAVYSAEKVDFGKVKEGDTVRQVITIKNSGEEPLYIFKASGSCECVRITYPGKPIMPDAEEYIVVYFDTKGRKGPQARSVIFSTNTEPSEYTFLLNGVVE